MFEYLLAKQALLPLTRRLGSHNSDGCGVRRSSLGRRSLVAGARYEFLSIPFRSDLIHSVE
jgi:hypothetical protein